MKGARGAWLAYAITTLGVTALLLGLGVLVLGEAMSAGLPAAALAAWVLQLVAFAGLLAVRDRPALFMTGFAGGMLLRVGIVAGAGLWLRATEVLPPLPTMIGFVVFLFVLLMLESVFLRKGERGG